MRRFQSRLLPELSGERLHPVGFEMEVTSKDSMDARLEAIARPDLPLTGAVR